MDFPAGWYDDPNDLKGQRYWDGASWTEHRRPRPGPAEPTEPPVTERATAAPLVYPGAAPYQGPAFQPGHQPGAPQPGGPQQYGAPQHGAPQQYGAPQYGAGQPGMPPYQAGFGYAPQVPSTPDGVPLSGWWKRVGARILDGLIVMVVSLPFSGWFWYQYVLALTDYQRDVFDRAVAGESPAFETTLPWDVYQWILPIAGIALVINFAYEYFFLVRSGATPGKKAVGISVRLREVPGPPPGLAVAKRYGLYAGVSLLGAIPGIGTLFSMVGLLDVLWPLWDDKKQALHDKVGKTNVVLGPQPRR
ncbi:RDD family protein [Kribbella amoyensis]|uniref:RDD family protein n=1 Tax=Kribbella amoyensis TaxID=996641 RepID=UPI00119FFC50|nr:RDD family protein [Kribbella amoyensis]